MYIMFLRDFHILRMKILCDFIKKKVLQRSKKKRKKKKAAKVKKHPLLKRS